MPLTLNCPKCRKPFRVREESVGMRVKCPTCAAVLQVPASISPASLDGSAASPSLATSQPPSPATATVRRPAPEPTHARPAKTGRGDSFLDDLAGPETQSSPPSLVGKGSVAQTQPLKPRRDEPLERSSRGTETSPLPSTRKPVTNAKPRQDEVDQEQIVEDADAWRRVRKGLFWVQLAYFLALLPAIGNFALIAYSANVESKAPEKFTDKGFLGTSLKMWEEIAFGYLFVIPILVYLFVLFGRASLLRVPESARTRGTASGLLLLTFVSFAAFATYACSLALPKLADTSLPREARDISWTVFIYFGLLTEAWFLIYLGQIGVPLRSTRTLRDTALSLLMLVVVVVGVLIANDYYPLLTSSPKVKLDEILNTRMIEAGVFLVIAFVLVFRITAVTSIIRRAINRWMEDNKETLEAVPE